MADKFEAYEKALSGLPANLKGIIEVSGASVMQGPIEAKTVEVSGSLTVNGDVTTENIEVSGSAKIRGNLKVGSAEISGSLVVDGDAFVSIMESSGGVSVKGNLKGSDMEVSGSLTAGNIEAELLSASGSVKSLGDLIVKAGELSGSCIAGGLIEADKLESAGSLKARRCRGGVWRISGSLRVAENIEVEELYIDLYGDSKVGGVIKAKKVVVRPGRKEFRGIIGGFLKFFSGAGRGRLRCKGIEAEEIDIENVDCDFVKARKLSYQNCSIGKVHLEGGGDEERSNSG